VSLLWRVYLPAAVVLVLAAVALIVLPVTVSAPALPAEIGVIVLGLAVLLVVSLVLVRRSLAPLRELVALARGVDLLRPGQRMRSPEPREIAEVVDAFNQMLDRLEAERAESARRTLLAQEAERSRIARELHDEVGQALTAVLLQLARASETAPADLRERLRAAQEAARSGLAEVGRVVRRLRPEALDDLGLQSALTALGAGVARQAGIAVHRRIGADLPAMSPEAELVVYRVAQEALTNVARHSGARQAWLSLERGERALVLEVADDGRGVAAAEPGAGGIRGMRERALLVDGELEVGAREGGGTRVRLEVPIGAEGQGDG